MKVKRNKFKTIPRFKTEDEERDFWATHDATDYFDFFKRIELDLSRLKPSTQSVTIRLPQMLVADVRMLANRRDVPYQSLMKILLAEKVQEEMEKLHA